MGLAVVVLPALLVAGACASTEERWCDRVDDAAPGIAESLDTGGTTTGLLDALPTLHELADAAPSDVQDEWATLVEALDGLDAALGDADLEPSEIAGELPADLAAADRKALETASLELASPEVRDAADAVDQQVRDVCQVALF